MKDWHAVQRAEKRAGLELTRDDVAEIWAKIDDGRAIRMRDGKRGTTRFALTVRGRAMQIVANVEARRLVTCFERPGKYPSNRSRG